MLAVASLAIGNLAAIAQSDVKRLLAYSSVSHAGFLLIADRREQRGRRRRRSSTTSSRTPRRRVGAFAVVAARERELARPVTLDSLEGLGWERPFLGVAMWVFML